MPTSADDLSLLCVLGNLFFGILLPTSARAALCDRPQSVGLYLWPRRICLLCRCIIDAERRLRWCIIEIDLLCLNLFHRLEAALQRM